MPGKFISIAEERGLIIPIGTWVIDEAARQAAVWQNAGTPIRIAVNVSAVQFRQKDFVDQLENSVRKHGIIPDNLELELTESIVMRDAETTVNILERLHNLGYQLSIDDFGTGYSSLSYLRRFPIDKIKIDQSFVRDENAGSIVVAVINLAHGLKVKVIAEGVETKKQLELLREHGCNEAQGFLFSPALVPVEFEKTNSPAKKTMGLRIPGLDLFVSGLVLFWLVAAFQHRKAIFLTLLPHRKSDSA